jgi:hypothetical protein
MKTSLNFIKYINRIRNRCKKAAGLEVVAAETVYVNRVA